MTDGQRETETEEPVIKLTTLETEYRIDGWDP